MVRLDYAGNVTFDDWAATMKGVFANQDYKPGFRFLVDWRRALAPDVDFVKRAAAWARQHKREISGSRVAMVVSDRATFGIMGLAKEQSTALFGRSWVFTNLKDAEHWLRSG